MPVAMSGKVVLITGANSGIGKVTARALAQRGATVVCTARDRERGEQAVADIRQHGGNPNVELLTADFAQMRDVRALAEQFVRRHRRLDVLINNAGLMLSRRRVTPDGFEETLAVNHLAPFLLTHLLRDTLERSAPARIVNVSSRAHKRGRLDFDDLHSARRYDGFGVYCATKLANILFTRELAQRLDERQVSANALHPGVVRTGFAGDGDAQGFFAFAFRLARPFMISAEQGAETSIYLATSAEVRGVTGAYFDKCKVAPCSSAAKDAAAARRLWQASEQMLGSEGVDCLAPLDDPADRALDGGRARTQSG